MDTNGYGDEEPPVAAVAPNGEIKEAKSPLVRALLHVKWATLLQKAGKYDRAEEIGVDDLERGNTAEHKIQSKSKARYENPRFVYGVFLPLYAV